MKTKERESIPRKSALVALPRLGIVAIRRSLIVLIALAMGGSGVALMLTLERALRTRLILGSPLSDAALILFPYAVFFAGMLAAILWIAYAGFCYRVCGPLVRLKATIRARAEGRRTYLRLRNGDYFSETTELLNREWVAVDSLKKATRELGRSTMAWLNDSSPSEEEFDVLKSRLRKTMALLGDHDSAERIEFLEFDSAPPRAAPRRDTLIDLPRGARTEGEKKWLEDLDTAIIALSRLRMARNLESRESSRNGHIRRVS
jgi:hypothetical protein